MLCFHMIFVGEAGTACEWHDEKGFIGKIVLEILPHKPNIPIELNDLVYKYYKQLEWEDR